MKNHIESRRLLLNIIVSIGGLNDTKRYKTRHSSQETVKLFLILVCFGKLSNLECKDMIYINAVMTELMTVIKEMHGRHAYC